MLNGWPFDIKEAPVSVRPIALLVIVLSVYAFFLTACVITTEGPVFSSSDYEEVPGMDGHWRLVASVDGDVEELYLRLDHLGAGRYRATPVIAEIPTNGNEPQFRTDLEERPTDFALVPLGGGDHIIVMTEEKEHNLIVAHAALRVTSASGTTYLFGSASQDVERAFADLLTEHGLEVDPGYAFETRLIGDVSSEALKAVFVDLLAQPETYGGYWSRYERVN